MLCAMILYVGHFGALVMYTYSYYLGIRNRYGIILVIDVLNLGHDKVSWKKIIEVLEWKISRKIFGPRNNNEEKHEIQNNNNLEEPYGEPSIVETTKRMRIKLGWACTVTGRIRWTVNGVET